MREQLPDCWSKTLGEGGEGTTKTHESCCHELTAICRLQVSSVADSEVLSRVNSSSKDKLQNAVGCAVFSVMLRLRRVLMAVECKVRRYYARNATEIAS